MKFRELPNDRYFVLDNPQSDGGDRLLLKGNNHTVRIVSFERGVWVKSATLVDVALTAGVREIDVSAVRESASAKTSGFI